MAGKFDFARVPYFEGNETAGSTTMGGWFLGINPNSQNKEAAAEFLTYFAGYELQLAAAVEDSRAPTIPSVYEDKAMMSAEVLARFGKNFDFGGVRPSATTGSNYPKVSETMQLAISSALNQRESVEDALNDAQSKIIAILEN